MTTDDAAARWIDAAIDRYSADLTPAELHRAIRALSARYVERRNVLASRSPLDSAGKRAAFGAFYAPLHFLTIRAIVSALGAGTPAPSAILDLGCGTGVASAAWALAASPPPQIRGCDTNSWAAGEAAWTWRTLGLSGRATRGDLVAAIADDHPRSRGKRPNTAIVAGWALNELTDPERAQVRPQLLSPASLRGPVLIVEPLAAAAAPWWREWTSACVAAGGRADEWKFPVDLPPRLGRHGRCRGILA